LPSNSPDEFKAGLGSRADTPGWLLIAYLHRTDRLFGFLRRQNQFVQLRQTQFINPAAVIDFQFTHLLEKILTLDTVNRRSARRSGGRCYTVCFTVGRFHDYSPSGKYEQFLFRLLWICMAIASLFIVWDKV
jgi:hypothetical protein